MSIVSRFPQQPRWTSTSKRLAISGFLMAPDWLLELSHHLITGRLATAVLTRVKQPNILLLRFYARSPCCCNRRSLLGLGPAHSMLQCTLCVLVKTREHDETVVCPWYKSLDVFCGLWLQRCHEIRRFIGVWRMHLSWLSSVHVSPTLMVATKVC